MTVAPRPARVSPDGGTNHTDTLARQAYLALREGIILGRYREGARLAEQRLAQDLAISRVCRCGKRSPNLKWKASCRPCPAGPWW